MSEVLSSKYIFFTLMKILLVGHSIIDTYKEGINSTAYPGGIFYSVLGINTLKNERDEVYLLTSMNEDSYQLFENQYESINRKYFVYREQMPEVLLKLPELGERIEIYKNVSGSLPIENVEDINSFDGILINMITGFDLTVEQLINLRAEYRGIIYFDVHTLSRGLDEKMKREFRKIPDVEKWLGNINLLQCNELELRTICECENESVAAGWILQNGIEILLITKAEKGAVCYYRKGSHISKIEEPGNIILQLNKIGCGDIFGAVFFYSYIATRKIASSLWLANKAGAGAAATNNLVSKSKIEL